MSKKYARGEPFKPREERFYRTYTQSNIVEQPDQVEQALKSHGKITCATDTPDKYRIKFLQEENIELRKLIKMYEGLFREDYRDLRRRYDRKVEECRVLLQRVTEVEKGLKKK